MNPVDYRLRNVCFHLVWVDGDSNFISEHTNAHVPVWEVPVHPYPPCRGDWGLRPSNNEVFNIQQVETEECGLARTPHYFHRIILLIRHCPFYQRSLLDSPSCDFCPNSWK
jgi:hypothetical protein